MTSRRRVLIARLGLVAAAMVVVWLLVSARLDASQARREQADQARAAAVSSAELRTQLEVANRDRDALAEQLRDGADELAALRTSVRELPGRLPRSTRTTTTTRVVTVPAPGPVTPSRVGPPGPPGPRGRPGAPASAAPARPGPATGPPAAAAPSRSSCVAIVAGTGVCDVPS